MGAVGHIRGLLEARRGIRGLLEAGGNVRGRAWAMLSARRLLEAVASRLVQLVHIRIRLGAIGSSRGHLEVVHADKRGCSSWISVLYLV